MRTKLRNTGSIILLTVFLLALVPDVTLQYIESRNTDLRETISSLQSLSQQANSGESDFIQTYTTAVLSLRQAAGIKAFIFDEHAPNGPDTKKIIIVSVNLPYILNSVLHPFVSLQTASFDIPQKPTYYTSISLLPGLPPPRMTTTLVVIALV